MVIRYPMFAVALLAGSGLATVFFGRRSMIGQWASALVNGAGWLFGLWGLALFFRTGGANEQMTLHWGLPVGEFRIGLDAVSLVFLIPIFLISGLGAVYGLGYWKQSRHPSNGRKLRLCWGVLSAAM